MDAGAGEKLTKAVGLINLLYRKLLFGHGCTQIIRINQKENNYGVYLCTSAKICVLINLFHCQRTADAGVRMMDDILPKNGRESWKNYP
jgi:hypothetical protein